MFGCVLGSLSLRGAGPLWARRFLFFDIAPVLAQPDAGREPSVESRWPGAASPTPERDALRDGWSVPNVGRGRPHSDLVRFCSGGRHSRMGTRQYSSGQPRSNTRGQRSWPCQPGNTSEPVAPKTIRPTEGPSLSLGVSSCGGHDRSVNVEDNERGRGAG